MSAFTLKILMILFFLISIGGIIWLFVVPKHDGNQDRKNENEDKKKENPLPNVYGWVVFWIGLIGFTITLAYYLYWSHITEKLRASVTRKRERYSLDKLSDDAENVLISDRPKKKADRMAQQLVDELNAVGL